MVAGPDHALDALNARGVPARSKRHGGGVPGLEAHRALQDCGFPQPDRQRVRLHAGAGAGVHHGQAIKCGMRKSLAQG